FQIRYNDVYEVNMPPGHRFPMEKYREVRLAVQEKIGGFTEVDYFIESPLATVEQLETTHDANYIHRYLTGQMTDAENRNIGFPWNLQHVNRTLSSVGGTYQSTTTQQQHDNMHLCWSAHVAGGTHHAFSDYGEGFCIFSDIAVAANVLLQNGIRRILIIDLDVHQGNGNAKLFDGNSDVWTFSMHCQGNYFSKKETSDLDIELPIGCGDETYISTLSHWLRRIEQHPFDEEEGSEDDTKVKKPFDLIFYQAGVDIHEDDRLGRLSITSEGMSRRNSLVYDFADRMRAPLVITMGGGYPK
ncbi:predicted protein, partial [Thalassiosira pseudonana CCMP1335]